MVVQITVQVTGDKLDANFMNKLDGSLMVAMDEILKISEAEAKKVYLEKRKATGVSAVIGSFKHKSLSKGKLNIAGIVFAGGSQASWTIYLEDDHKLRNDKMWSSVNPEAPYKFMEAGWKKGTETGEKIISDTISRIMI